MTGRAFWLAALAALGGCTSAAAPQSSAPERPTIVSLNPCTDAVLAEVADPAQVLAISHYSKNPRSSSMDVASAARFPATGGTAEEVAALKPDLVIAGTFLAPATRAALARMGIRVATVGIASNVEQSLTQVREVAALAGQPERGEQVARRIERALAAAAPPAGAALIPAVMWQSGGIVPGENSLVGDMMRRTGFSSHSAARGLQQADHLPLERMLADPPRVIFAAGFADSGADSADDRMLSHPALGALAGTRYARFDPALLYCGGPTLAHAAARLAQVRAEIEP